MSTDDTDPAAPATSIDELLSRKPPLDPIALRAVIAKYRMDRHHMAASAAKPKAEKPPKAPRAKKVKAEPIAVALELLELDAPSADEDAGV